MKSYLNKSTNKVKEANVNYSLNNVVTKAIYFY